jgi:ATPase subunit of ABC transporter with duplicated ATPase domains
MLDKLKDNGEKSLKRTIESQNKRIEESQEKLLDAKKNIVLEKKVKFDFKEKGSGTTTLFACTQINIAPGGLPLWLNPLTFSISKNDRIRIMGVNGSGKSSLCRVITGELPIITGEVTHHPKNVIYFDQTLSFLDPESTILENALKKGDFKVSETEIRIRLGRLGFYGEDCKKQVSSLSGGELIKAAVGVLVSMPEAPSLLILDEPTNNLDLKGIEMLSSALRNFKSALLVITHDDDFANDLGITTEIHLRVNLRQ